MTTIALPDAPPPLPSRRPRRCGPRWPTRSPSRGATSLGYVRTPQLLIFSTIQPVIFVLLFRYVFGGAINVPGSDYVDFLMPGIFAQTVVFGAIGDGHRPVERPAQRADRTVPLAADGPVRGAAGRTTRGPRAATCSSSCSCASSASRSGGRSTPTSSAVRRRALLMLRSATRCRGSSRRRARRRDAEAAQAASFPILAPLVFASSAFVPVASMPSWLQGFARNQPVSAVTTAVRGLTLGGADHQQRPHRDRVVRRHRRGRRADRGAPLPPSGLTPAATTGRPARAMSSGPAAGRSFSRATRPERVSRRLHDAARGRTIGGGRELPEHLGRAGRGRSRRGGSPATWRPSASVDGPRCGPEAGWPWTAARRCATTRCSASRR